MTKLYNRDNFPCNMNLLTFDSFVPVCSNICFSFFLTLILLVTLQYQIHYFFITLFHRHYFATMLHYLTVTYLWRYSFPDPLHPPPRPVSVLHNVSYIFSTWVWFLFKLYLWGMASYVLIINNLCVAIHWVSGLTNKLPHVAVTIFALKTAPVQV